MIKYDCIVALGCSFIHGANILDNNNRFAGKEYRASKILSRHYKCKEINLATPGFGNDSILTSGYDWIRQNKTYNNPLFIIGLSGLTRERVWSNYNKRYWDLHIFDFPDKSNDKYIPLLNERAEKICGPNCDPLLLEKYVEMRAKYMFNFEQERKKLSQNIILFNTLLNKYNYQSIFFNSICEDIDSIKKEINYLSFDIDKINDDVYRLQDVPASENIKKSAEDCWYHYIRKQMKKDGYHMNDSSLRSNVPPYGKHMCGGHPSPNSNQILANKLIEYENNI